MKRYSFGHTISFIALAIITSSCVSYTVVPASLNSPIRPGNTLRITMTNGEVYKTLKVTAVDSLKITGIQRFVDSDGRRYSFNKVILVKEIQAVEISNVNVDKTSALVISMAVLLGLIFAISAFENSLVPL